VTFAQILSSIPKWFLTVLTILENSAKDEAATVAVEGGAKPLSVLDLIKQERGSFGPSPRTGGVAKRVSDADAAVIASLIEQYAVSPLDPAMICAWFRGESYFDPNCINPNNQNAVAGEDELAAFKHTDIGIGQFDGKELLDMLPTIPWQVAKAKALDPTWAIPQFARMASGLLAWAQKEDSFMRSRGVAPVCTPEVLAFQAYNAGRTGALARVLNASLEAAVTFAIDNGILVLISDAAAYTSTKALRAKITDSTFGYGDGLNARWAHYKTLLGQK